jgi:hypothetical protein
MTLNVADKCPHLLIQHRENAGVFPMVVVEAVTEVETTLVVEAMVIHSTSPRTGSHRVNYVEGQIIQFSSATKGLIQHTWGMRNLLTQPTLWC